MNLALLDLGEVQAPLPEVIEDKLEPPDEVLLCAFNRRGNLLAGGCRNGAVVIWDFDTHGIAQTLMSGAGARVTSVSWTRSSRRLLSSSADGALILWDVLTGEQTQRLDLGGEIIHAALHPRKRSLCVACVGTGPACQAFLISLHPAAEQRIPLLPGSIAEAQAAEGGGGGEGGGGEGGESSSSKKAASVSYACFSADGASVMVGTSRGAVHFLSTASREELFTVQLPGASSIKSLNISRDGKCFLANSADRVIRAYSLERVASGDKKVQPRELQDVVNRMQWAHASFSPGAADSEHVVGTANSATDHHVYIWDMHGHLIKILGQGEKIKDGALWFACHPTRPILAACARSGAIYIWTKRYSENWSAFAPDFKELEENEEYEEKEDEFDIKAHADMLNEDEKRDEDEAIDIVSVQQTDLDHVPDAEDDDAELLFLPVTPQMESASASQAGAQGGNGAGGGLMSGMGGEEGDADDGGKGGKARAGKRKSLG